MQWFSALRLHACRKKLQWWFSRSFLWMVSRYKMSFHFKFEVLPPVPFTQIRTEISWKRFFSQYKQRRYFSVSHGRQNRAEAGSVSHTCMIHILFHSHAIFCWRAHDWLPAVLVQHLAAHSGPGSTLEPPKNSGALSSLISSSNKKQDSLFIKKAIQLAGFFKFFVAETVSVQYLNSSLKPV